MAPDGGRILTGGLGAGWSVLPTIVVDAPPTARVCREEIFGPVCVVQRFQAEADAIAAANDTRYGLNAMVFTENLSRAHRVSAALRAGTVWVNCFFIRDLRAPFGGVGDSGVGREGGHVQPGVLHRAEGRHHADRRLGPNTPAGSDPTERHCRAIRQTGPAGGAIRLLVEGEDDRFLLCHEVAHRRRRR